MNTVRPLSLIMLADIQNGIFGINKINVSNSKEANVRAMAFTNNLVAHIQEHHGSPQEDNQYALFVLGDVSSTADPVEYEIVSRQLLTIAIRLRITLKRIYFCPGNHDFSIKVEAQDPEKRFKNYFDFNNKGYL